MAQAKNGDTVKVHYTGKLEDESVFVSNMDGDPLKFTLGKDKILMSFQNVIVGMKPGESKSVKIPAEKAYGPHRKELVHKVARNLLRKDLKPEVGKQLEFKKKNGEKVVFTVLDISESSVTIDANHPLAGKDLTFDVILEEIVLPLDCK